MTNRYLGYLTVVRESKYHMVSLTCKILKKQVNGPKITNIKKKKKLSDEENKLIVANRGGRMKYLKGIKRHKLLAIR